MKALTASVVFLLFVLFTTGVYAQSGGGSSGSSCSCSLTPGDESTGCYSTSNGIGNNPWRMTLVVDILKQAKDYYSLSLGQMIQEYHECRCTITYLGSGWFRVSTGASGVCCVDVFQI